MVLLMLSVTLIACADNKNNDLDTTTPSGNVSGDSTATPGDTNTPNGQPAGNVDENGYLKDDLPDGLNFGKTVSIMCWNSEQPEFDVKEQTGDIVSDAIYTRNLNTETRLGITLKYIEEKGDFNNQSAWITAAEASIKSGGEYDIFAGYSMTGASVAVKGFALDMLSQSYLDFEKPWWPESLISQATINDKLYFASGDISTNMLHFMYAVFFNKQIIIDNNLENPYELVDNQKWTYTKMLEMASNLYSDNNGDGVKDQNDSYGLCTAAIHYDAFFTGAGLETVVKDANDQLVLSSSFNSEKTVKLLEDVYNFMWNGKDGYHGSTGAVFSLGNTLFTLDRSYMGLLRKDDITFEYGIVPVPKFDEQQEKYVTCMAFPFTMYEISAACKDPEVAAATLECLCSEGYRNVTPMLFETSMKLKYSSDNEASRMYDIIRDGVSIDMGRLFCTELQNFPYSLFRNICENKAPTNTWASSYKAAARIMEKALQNINSSLAALK